MKKFTFFVMAVPCLLMISCATEIATTEEEYTDNVIEYRSAEKNNITTTFTSIVGDTTDYKNTQTALAYLSIEEIQATLVNENGTSLITTCNLAYSRATGENVLLVTVDGGTPFQADDIQIDICNGQLCYKNSIETISGSGLNFIIEDLSEGI